MARRPGRPRKRRTREHIIASQSANFVERFIVELGFSFEAIRHDYGYDLAMYTFDEDGYAEEGFVYLQLKATDSVVSGDGVVLFVADVRDYLRWISEPMPVFLIVYDATERQAYWLYVQHYFELNPPLRPKANAKTVRVHIPYTNKVDVDFVRYARKCKAGILAQLKGKVRHYG